MRLELVQLGENVLHSGHRIRLREKFIKNGLDGFADHETLELLLTYAIPRRNTNDIAHALLDQYGSLRAVLEADVRDLALMDGIGENTAVFLSLLRELERRLMLSPRKKRILLNTPLKTGEYLRALLSGRRYEEFYVICLDARMGLINSERLNVGNVSEVVAYPRFVVDAARRHASHSVIISHNHPSGTPFPSKADFDIGLKVADALEACGISYLDHFIVTDEGYYSIKANQSYAFPEMSENVLPAAAEKSRALTVENTLEK